MKKPMKPLILKTEDGPTTLVCKHQAVWPPIHAFLGESFEALHAARDIDDRKLQQLQVWERTCGLRAMSADKCPTCPHAMVDENGVLVPYVNQTGSKPVHPPFARAKQNRRRR